MGNTGSLWDISSRSCRVRLFFPFPHFSPLAFGRKKKVGKKEKDKKYESNRFFLCFFFLLG